MLQPNMHSADELKYPAVQLAHIRLLLAMAYTEHYLIRFPLPTSRHPPPLIYILPLHTAQLPPLPYSRHPCTPPATHSPLPASNTVPDCRQVRQELLVQEAQMEGQAAQVKLVLR